MTARQSVKQSKRWMIGLGALVLSLVMHAASGRMAVAQIQPLPTEAAVIAKAAKRLGAKDYEHLYVGNTLSGATADGDAFHVFVASSSAYRMLFQGKRTSDRWSVGDGGTFCAIADGTATCTREYMLDGIVYSFNTDGTIAGWARIVGGNPETL